MAEDRLWNNNRRELLQLSAGSLSAAIAGCTGILNGRDDADEETTDESQQTTGGRSAADGELTELETSPSEVKQGQEIGVTASIANTGEATLDGVLDVSFDGESVTEERLTVDGGGRETLTVSIQQWQAGTYDTTATLRTEDAELDTARTQVTVVSAHSAFVGVNGTEFVIDGEPVYYSGGHGGGNLNSRTASDDPNGWDYEYDEEFDGEHYVADFMQYVAEYEMPVIRVVTAPIPWAENSTVHDAPGEFNEAWFELFDTVVAEAMRNEVRLIVSPLSHDMDLAPSPGAYAKWSETVDADGLNRDELYDAFFHDEQANEYYRNFLEKLLTRENHITGVEYRKDPTILMWECGNEMEYRNWDDRGKSLAGWYDGTARYIKSLDDEHLVGSGMYGSDARNEFVEDHRSEAIDVCSIHLYPKYPNRSDIAEKPYEEGPAHDMSIDEMVAYLEDRVETAHSELGKPIILGEFNVPQFPDIYGWDLAMRREYFEAVYDVADRTDMNGVHAYAQTLNKKCTGEVRITDCRAENGIYPDDELLSIITTYSETVAEKSAGDITR